MVPPIDIDYGTCTVNVFFCPCDYDLDGNCNIAGGDLGLFAPCWSVCDSDPEWDQFSCADKDFDCSGCVSGGDLGWFAGVWLQTCDAIDHFADYPPCRPCSSPVSCTGRAARGGGVVDTGRAVVLDVSAVDVVSDYMVVPSL